MKNNTFSSAWQKIVKLQERDGDIALFLGKMFVFSHLTGSFQDTERETAGRHSSFFAILFYLFSFLFSLCPPSRFCAQVRHRGHSQRQMMPLSSWFISSVSLPIFALTAVHRAKRKAGKDGGRSKGRHRRRKGGQTDCGKADGGGACDVYREGGYCAGDTSC